MFVLVGRLVRHLAANAQHACAVSLRQKVGGAHRFSTAVPLQRPTPKPVRQETITKVSKFIVRKLVVYFELFFS